MSSHGGGMLSRMAARMREWLGKHPWLRRAQAGCDDGLSPLPPSMGAQFSHALILILAATSLACFAQPASARTIHPALGGSGDRAVRDECAPGEYLVGVEARTGSWWDRIRIRCAPSTASGGVGPLGASHQAFGGRGGGSPREYRCGDNSVMVSAHIILTPQNQVAYVTLGCSPNPRAESGITNVSTAGSQFAEGQRRRQRCPVGEAATGFDIRYGEHVNALGLICDTYNTPPAPASNQNAANEQRKFEVQVTGKSISQCQQSNAMCEARFKAMMGPINSIGAIVSECTPYLQPCLANAALAQKAYADERTEEMRVTGKTQEQCVRSNQSCELRMRQRLGVNALGVIPQECTPFFSACMANAAADLAKAASSATSNPQPAPAGGGTTSICGVPGGPATVNIPNSDVTEVNVRDRPNGAILSQIPAGTQVNVVGGCGIRIAAGIVAQKPGAVTGWCAISSPQVGCVSEQFLLAGAAAGGFGPAAGIVASRPNKPQPHSNADPSNGETVRVVKDANVRDAPSSKNTTVIAKLPRGSMVIATDCSTSWCRVDLPGHRQAWVSRSLLAFEDADDFEDAGPVIAAPDPLQGGGPTSACGVAGGTATVSIPDPNLTTLNVRDRPSGTILTVIPEGSQVNVVGGCGARRVAGIVAQKPGGGGQQGVPGWCAISSPVVGCVSEQFLVAGIPAGNQAPVAGAVARRPVGSFTGTWDATAQGSGYTMQLDQDGKSVVGSYTSDDGSSGRIEGTLRRNVLRFRWRQADGLGGAGKFALSEDANSFNGSFTLGDNPDVNEGSWDGQRQ